MKSIKGSSKFSTKQIAYMGIIIAIGIVVNSLRFGIFSFGGLPIIFSGYALGPLLGFVVGGLTDVLAFIVRPSAAGAPNIIFVLTSAFTGLIPVTVSGLLGDKYPKYRFWTILIGIIIGQFLTSVLVVPYFVDKLYLPGTFYIKMSQAATKQIIQSPIYAYVIDFLLKSTTDFIDYRNLK